ncbi:MAG: TonB-dependent receptor, partial [Nitrospirota bacterium]
SLEELYSAPISDIQPSHDPKNGNAFNSETTTLVVSNPNLLPEESETFSGGFVYTPKIVPGLTISTDIWQIDRTNVVQSPFLDDVLAREVAGTLLPGERVERINGVNGDIVRITVPNRNEASQKANGVDFGIQYVKETPWGTFTSLTQATYLNSFEVQRVAGGRIEQLAGISTDPGAGNEGYYRWRGDSRLDWTWKGFDVIGTVRYIDGFREPADPDGFSEHFVEHRWLFDLQASYDFSALVAKETVAAADYSKGGYSKNDKAGPPAVAAGGMSIRDLLLNGTTITVGCNNVFDKDPPAALGQFGNGTGYPGYTYDSTGRFVYVRLTKKF